MEIVSIFKITFFYFKNINSQNFIQKIYKNTCLSGSIHKVFVKKEKGIGFLSAGFSSNLLKSIVFFKRRGGVPVRSLPILKPNCENFCESFVHAWKNFCYFQKTKELKFRYERNFIKEFDSYERIFNFSTTLQYFFTWTFSPRRP